MDLDKQHTALLEHLQSQVAARDWYGVRATARELIDLELAMTSQAEATS